MEERKVIEYRDFSLKHTREGMVKIMPLGGRGNVPVHLSGIWTKVTIAKKAVDAHHSSLAVQALEIIKANDKAIKDKEFQSAKEKVNSGSEGKSSGKTIKKSPAK